MIDMIIVARQVQENTKKQIQSLYISFTDLTKGFDMVDRNVLWSILTKFGGPAKFLTFRNSSMQTCVLISGPQSPPYLI